MSISYVVQDDAASLSHTVDYPEGTVEGDFVIIFAASRDTPDHLLFDASFQHQHGGVKGFGVDLGAQVAWKESEGETSTIVTSEVSTVDATPTSDNPIFLVVRIPAAEIDAPGALLSSNTASKRGYPQSTAGTSGTYTVSFDALDSRPVVSGLYHWFEFVHFEAGTHLTDYGTPAGWTRRSYGPSAVGSAGNKVALWYQQTTDDTLTPGNLTATDDGFGLENHVIGIGLAVPAVALPPLELPLHNIAEGGSDEEEVLDDGSNTGGESEDAFNGTGNNSDAPFSAGHIEFTDEWSSSGDVSYKMDIVQQGQTLDWFFDNTLDVPITVGTSWSFPGGAEPEDFSEPLGFLTLYTDGADNVYVVLTEDDRLVQLGDGFAPADAIDTSTNTYGLNGDDARLELDFNPSSGAATLRLYDSAADTVPAETLTATIPTATTVNNVEFGNNGNGDLLDAWYLDDLFVEELYVDDRTMAMTLVCDGFEHGVLTEGTETQSFLEDFLNATIQDNKVNNGTYALRLDATSDYAWIQHGEFDRFPDPTATTPLTEAATYPQEHTWSIYFRLDHPPEDNVHLFYERDNSGLQSCLGVAWNASTGCLRAFCHDESDVIADYFYGDDGFAPASGRWYLLDMKLTYVDSADDATVEWRVDGAAQPTGSFTNTNGMDFLIKAVVGNQEHQGESATTMDMNVDDWLVVRPINADDYPGYPVGPHKVSIIYPVNDGTSNNANHFTDNSANSPPTTPYSRVDDSHPEVYASTDFVKQTTANAASYMEYLHNYLPSTTRLLGGVAAVAAKLPGAGTTVLHTKLYINGEARWVVYNVGPSTTKDTFAGAPLTGMLKRDATMTTLNESTFRHGYATDVTPNVEVHALWMQVARSLTPMFSGRYIDQLRTGAEDD